MPDEPLDRPEDVRSHERWSAAGLVLLFGLVLAFPAYRLGEPARRAAAREAMKAEYVRLGAEAYDLHCASCHGDEGEGRGTLPALAVGELLDAVSNEQLHWIIAGGLPGTSMAAYHLDYGGPLTDQDIEQVIAFLRSLRRDEDVAAPEPSESAVADSAKSTPPDDTSAPGASSRSATVAKTQAPSAPAAGLGPESSTTAAPPPARSATSTSGAARTESPGTGAAPALAAGSASSTVGSERAAPSGTGEALALAGSAATEAPPPRSYVTHCAVCHGENGEGRPPLGPALLPLPARFADDRPALVRVIRVGVPGTSMMGYGAGEGGPLDAQAIEAIVRWLER